VQAKQHFKQCRFAGSVVAEQRENLALVDSEVDGGEDFAAAIAGADMARGESDSSHLRDAPK